MCIRDSILTEEFQHHLHGADGSQRIDDVLTSVLGSRTADRLKHGNAIGVDIAPCGDAHTALDHGAQVSNYIAEDVVGYDDIEPLRAVSYTHLTLPTILRV